MEGIHPSNSADVTYCSIRGIGGVNNISGREEDCTQVAVNTGWIKGGGREECWRGKKGLMREEELKMRYLFCMNGINQEDNCVVCEVMTSIQGNSDHAWIPEGGMWVGLNPHTNCVCCVCGQSALLSTVGTRAPPPGGLGYCRTLWGAGNMSNSDKRTHILQCGHVAICARRGYGTHEFLLRGFADTKTSRM